MINEEIIKNFVWSFERVKNNNNYFEDPFNSIIDLMSKTFGKVPIDIKMQLIDIFFEWYSNNELKYFGSNGLKKYLSERLLK